MPGTGCGEFGGARRHRVVEFRIRDDLVDKPPVEGALATHPFLHGTEHIAQVAPDLSLVGQPREAAGSR